MIGSQFRMDLWGQQQVVPGSILDGFAGIAAVHSAAHTG
jgi:hypothetical protein